MPPPPPQVMGLLEIWLTQRGKASFSQGDSRPGQRQDNTASGNDSNSALCDRSQPKLCLIVWLSRGNGIKNASSLWPLLLRASGKRKGWHFNVGRGEWSGARTALQGCCWEIIKFSFSDQLDQMEASKYSSVQTSRATAVVTSVARTQLCTSEGNDFFFYRLLVLCELSWRRIIKTSSA